MEELKKIIENLKKIRKESLSSLSDDTLFENAIKIFISREIGKQRQTGFKPINNPQKATEKQKAFLIGLGYEGDDLNTMTKETAQEMIKKLLNTQGSY